MSAYANSYEINQHFNRQPSSQKEHIVAQNVTVTVTTMVVVGEQTKSFTATGETDGNPHRLARSLTRSITGDVIDWSVDQPDKPELIGGWLDATNL